MTPEHRLAFALAEPAVRRGTRNTAIQLFNQASIECPASATAQGAQMARRIRQEGIVYAPESLLVALETDPQAIATIKDAGLRHHARRNIKPTKPVTEKTVREMTASAYKITKALEVCSMEDLEDVLDQFAELRRRKLLPKAEMVFRLQVGLTIAERRNEQGIPEGPMLIDA